VSDNKQTLCCGEVAVAVANPMVRHTIKDAFRRRGIGAPLDIADCRKLVTIAESTQIALLVVDAELGDQQTGELVRGIRRGQLHAHPFPLIICLANAREETYVRGLIDCGPDALVLSPVSLAQIFTKVDLLAAGRKQFVVTRDYVGPTRRSGPRAESSQSAVLVDVPNPLADGAGPAAFALQVRKGLAAMDAAYVKCSLGQLEWAAKGLAAVARTPDYGQLIEAVELLLRRVSDEFIRAVAEDLMIALRSGDPADIAAKCRQFLNVLPASV
jgi:DNA-binding NarL/FixJ family response regulator